MSPLHLLNVLIHILAGSAAIALGMYVLATPKDTLRHRKRGRLFVALALVVCTTAVIGNALFRFMPLFALLTLLVSYQLLSGWHLVHTRAAGPDMLDAGLLGAAAVSAAMLGRQLSAGGAFAEASASVLVSTLGAVLALLVYDAARWLFPRPWHATLWRYEHIYKMLGSLFAMLSAAVGNTVRIGQPWSQLAPSAIGLAVIAWCCVRQHRSSVQTGGQTCARQIG